LISYFGTPTGAETKGRDLLPKWKNWPSDTPYGRFHRN